MSRQFVTAPPSWRAEPTSELVEWLRPLQRFWHEGINWATLPWFAEEKARQGAFAAFLGICFERAEADKRGTLFLNRAAAGSGKRGGRWEALAVGDSCLFQIRENTLLRAFPVEEASAFDSRPTLMSSNEEYNETAVGALRTAEGDFASDDLFVLATDALGKWFLARHESGEQPWQILLGLRTAQDFENFVGGLRATMEMRNDDTTLVLVRWLAKAPRTAPARRMVATGLPESP